jgi:ribosomal-protein-alanine N-acetyltransferase
VNPRVFLRQARPSDVPALAALEASCFTHPWTEAQVAEEVAAAPPGGVLVLEGPRRPDGAGGVCAYCAFRVVLDEVHVMNVAVAPGERRRGLAHRLLGVVLRRAARAGARRAFLELRAGNRGALALYESLGFRRLSLRRAYYREPVEDALVLVREGLDEPREPRRASSRTLNPTRAACYRAVRGHGAPRAPDDAPPNPTRGFPSDPAGGAEMPQEPVSPASVHVDEYRQLEAQHHEYESRLGELAEKAVLSDEEQVEETTLKKKKLQIKDRMQEITRRSRGAAAHP